MLDLNQLALFVQVVQSGSFDQAARRLSMPSTTLSRQVAQLEDALQARLLQRTTRKLSLTDAGRTLYDQSVRQIEALNETVDQLSGGRKDPQGRIRVAAPANFFDFFVMEWVADYLRRYPEVRVEFVLSDTMADFVGEGIDVAFRGSAALPDSSMVARKVATSSMVLAASPAYLAARGTPQTIDDLASHDCIRAVHASGPNPWRLIGPDGPVQISTTGRFSANTAQAQKMAAIQGLGICLLPFNIVDESLRTGALAEVLQGVASSVGNLYVVYPSRRHVPRAVTAFVEMVVQHLPALTRP
jgi:DNA-binding transcriptional LysR family regulator